MYEVTDHPEAPSKEEMGEYVVEPVAPAEIDRKRDSGLTLVEENLLEHDAVDAYVELTQPEDTGMVDVGTVLYRLVQIFGTPQLPEYQAGNDISWRTNETFKYLLRIREASERLAIPDGESEADAPEFENEWLVTVFDYKLRLGIGLADWREDPDATVAVDPEDVVPLMAVVKNGVVDPVQCEYKDKIF